MENNSPIPDHTQREKALDVTQSFIVQAPAGSGKTELLTQRFLALLAKASSSPEEIIAITFTRKAAAEMRERIIESLKFAKQHPAPQTSHEYKTWQLAKDVLEKDEARHWNILQNPNRLRIFTIDSLCARIAKAAPLLSHFGSVPEVVEDATEYYVLAAQSLLGALEDNQSYSDALEQLMLHLDNNYLTIERLFIGMLQRRDQWLPYLVGKKNTQQMREKLEQGLSNIILNALEKCAAVIPNHIRQELISLAVYAANNLDKSAQNTIYLSQCSHLDAIPEISITSVSQWQGLAELLLTKQYEWRRSVNKTIGFPASSQGKTKAEQELFKEMKDRMTVLLESCEENEALRIALQEILLLPPAYYTDKQWCVIESLMILLPMLVAHLHIIFQENNVVDFTEIAQGAIDALGDLQNPSELSLNFDYKIQHILVDEFQDTSASQFHLLELLLQGWSPDDGRTLFLVGDPMQSIYRFREADVAIFLRVKKLGIGPLKPQSLTLHVNFRSEKGIIDWVNDTFAPIFPGTEDINCGAVAYNFSQAIHANTSQQHVVVHNLKAEQEDEEANLIVNVIKNSVAENPEVSVAILVRSRSHLERIIPSLKSAQIPFHAVEIEKLKNCSVVQDLYALTKALCHLGDRVAWLAILRAPWCGLTLADLYVIANLNPNKTIWQTILQLNETTTLSPDGLARINRIMSILKQAFLDRRRNSLRNHVAKVWSELGGPACLDYNHELENAEKFFQLLDEVDHAGDIINFELFDIKLDNLYTHSSSDSKTNVHIMTIHKAKGLEFDIVILPGLNRKSANDDNRLLLWCERKNDLILAPIKSLDDEFDPIYRYVRIQDSIRARHEIVRLLYVATTRAKKCLHLISCLSLQSENPDVKPENGSFLEFLWPQIKTFYTNNQEQIEHQQNDCENANKTRYIKRLSLDWQITPHPVENNFNINSLFKYQWQFEYQHHVGTLIHLILQKISQDKFVTWNEEKISQQQNLWRRKLLQLGVNLIHVQDCLDTINFAIKQTLQDSRGCWILDDTHKDAHSEFAVSSVVDDKICHYIIDRCFVDENGIRWIIDYKTTQITDKDIAKFLLYAKKQHQAQLESYANALQHFDKAHPIRIGLYFPLFKGWMEWSYGKCP